MKTRSLHLILVAVISALLGYYIGISKISFDWKNYKPYINISSKEPPKTVSNVDFSKFWIIWGRLENSYYDKKAINPDKLVQGAISGMVAALEDPYTVYLPPKQNQDFKEGLAGQKFEGIGAELGMKDKQLIVVAPLDGLPAFKSGIKAGDAILKVDGKGTDGWTLVQAVEKIRGPKGTAVTLTVLHKDGAKPVDISIKRDTINIKSAEGWIKTIKEIGSIKSTEVIKGKENKEIVYIRVSQFGDKTNNEWLTTINTLFPKIQNNSNVAGVILDLRNNPGGYLTDATFIASEFVKSGTIVTQEKGNGERLPFTVERRGLFLDIPVIVLVNKGSASASEIVAGALRDHKRAKLVGEVSFGKGTIQQAEDLGEGSGIHVTIAKWLTPNDTWVHGKGLTPDITVANDDKDQGHDLQLEKAVEELVK